MRFRGECTEDAPLFQWKGKDKERRVYVAFGKDRLSRTIRI